MVIDSSRSCLGPAREGSMKTRLRKLLGTLSLIAPALSSAQTIPPQVEAVRNYMLTADYPESFSQTRYRVQVKNMIVADLDGDGVPEVIAHMKPHFRQSPTIVIFKVDKDLHVQRVMEAFAPGPLRPVSGNYLDSHASGEGVDLHATTKTGGSADAALVQGLIKSQKGALVVYKQFAHLDARRGLPSYIDMRGADLPADANTCGDFEFSDVEQVEITSRFSSDGHKVIAARVGQQVFAIRIERFLPDGLLEKSVTAHAL